MSQSKNAPLQVSNLFQSAHAEGVLSPGSLQTLSGVALGSQIQAGLGVHVDDVLASEVVLLTIMPDDSGSIRFSGNAQAVRDGHNLILDALKQSGQGDDVLAHTRYLGGKILFPYRPLDDAIPMNQKNYDPNKGTPLYDQTVVLLGSVVAKAQEFLNSGVVARSVTLLITDGADEHSVRARAKDVRQIVKDMTATETHIVAAMGIDNGSTNFRKVFQEMGIQDQWILTPTSDPHAIREAFQVFSRSAVRASQAAHFSHTALAGFTA
jgi:hypothetical protein